MPGRGKSKIRDAKKTVSRVGKKKKEMSTEKKKRGISLWGNGEGKENRCRMMIKVKLFIFPSLFKGGRAEIEGLPDH